MTGDSTRHDPLEHADWDGLVEQIEASGDWVVVQVKTWNSMCEDNKRLKEDNKRLNRENSELSYQLQNADRGVLE